MSLGNDFKLIPENKFFALAVEVMQNVKTFLIDLPKNSNHFPHLKVVYSACPLVELMEQKTLIDYFDIKRLIYGVMTELNGYDIEFCTPPNYNYLAFNNMDFGKVGFLFTDVGLEIQQSQTKIKNSRQIGNNTHDYLSIRTLSSFFISSNFQMYANDIKLNWKGDQLAVEDINTDLIDMVSSPYKIYSLYSIYMKFCLSVIFYEMYDYYCTKRLKVFRFDALDRIKDTLSTDFVEITDNIYLLKSYFIDPEKNKKSINKLTRNIKNLFTKIGVSKISMSSNVCYPDINNLNISEVNDSDEVAEHIRQIQTRVENISEFAIKVKSSFRNNELYVV